MKYLFLFFLVTLSLSTQAQSETYLANVESGTFYSETLQMEKSYQVFLPESYNYSTASIYPVVYLMDGDYNFYYQTGIVEMLSNISEKIPEVIVVGISDNGNAGYKKDCTVKTENNPEGNTATFIKYLETELLPKIKSQYRASSYDVLIGHSLGGLFATNVLLQKPDLFDAYIAIDPSYWWENNLIVATADSLFENKEDLPANLFVTLADTKQMGVHEFIGVLEKRFPDAEKWKFNYYKNENHGSVGMVSVKEGLQHIFVDWELKRAEFYTLGTATKIMDYYKNLSKKYQGITRIPPLLFSNINYYFFRKEQPEELAVIEAAVAKEFPASRDDYYAQVASFMIESEKYEAAEQLLNKSVKGNPNAYKSYDGLSKLCYATGKSDQAIESAEKALKIAKTLKARQWQINELTANLTKVKRKK